MQNDSLRCPAGPATRSDSHRRLVAEEIDMMPQDLCSGSNEPNPGSNWPTKSELRKAYWPCNNASALALAKQARLIARGRMFLYYPTRYRSSILASGVLANRWAGPSIFYFTRSAEDAGNQATMLGYDADEGSGAIFIFDRTSLKAHYRIYVDAWPGGRRDSCEELIFVWNIDIGPHLIGFVSEPIATLPPDIRAEVRARKIAVGRGINWGLAPNRLKDEETKALDQLRRQFPELYEDLLLSLGEIDNFKG